MRAASELESSVRYYGPRFPASFVSASGSEIVTEDGRRIIDFLSACGALNYGHNHPRLKRAVMDHLARDGLLATLDLATPARREFLRAFERVVLAPRGLDYRVQFTGPTGTNAVEAALKLARKVTGRTTVVAFSNAFHGVTLGALAMSGGQGVRAASRALLQGVHRLPFEGYQGASADDLPRYEAQVADPSGGLEPPAAFIVETVQGEGGLNVASTRWLRTLSDVARRLGALLIVDDVQAGCGRTGRFFSFERAGIEPDIVCLAKSLSGLGLPMAITLVRPDRDVWTPGEHNGTFRGNALAFVAATEALALWEEGFVEDAAARRTEEISDWTRRLLARWPGRGLSARGLGMMSGVVFSEAGMADAVARRAFELGVMIETAGPNDEVLKLFPALTIDPATLADGLGRIANAVADVLSAGEEVELVA